MSGSRDGLVIGTRGSALALWQAEWVQSRLGGAEAGVRLEIIKTTGDRRLDVSLAASPDKGMFTKELEEALLEGRVDVAVHSLKDLPTTLPDGLALSVVPERAPCSDVLLTREDALAEGTPLRLKPGARVGTSSPRRTALLRHVQPDVEVPEPFRGNVPTRVRKCADGEVDAVLLARAGVSRLALDVSPLVAFDLDTERWLPAPGQGALGLEVRGDDARTRERLQPLHHEPTARAVGLERALLARLEAGCHAALGAWARPEEGDAWQCSAGALGDDGRWHVALAAGTDDGELVDELSRQLEGLPAEAGEDRWATPAAPWRGGS